MSNHDIKEIAEDLMEVYYQRDRATSDGLFKDIMKKQEDDSKKIDRLTKMVDNIITLLKKVS